MMHENTWGFYIYELTNTTNGDVEYLFFSPDKSIWDVLRRHYEVKGYKDIGFEVTSMKKVYKDEYLNTKIDHKVFEYCAEDNYEQYTRQRWANKEISDKVAIETLELIQSRKNVLMSQIGTLIRRCGYADLDVNNEIALALYDEHLKTLRN